MLCYDPKYKNLSLCYAMTQNIKIFPYEAFTAALEMSPKKLSFFIKGIN